MTRTPPTLRLSEADVIARAWALTEAPGRRLLGIVGSPGAGKSTLSEIVATALGERAVLVGMDGFHLDDPVLETFGRSGSKGAPDTFDVGGYVALLRRLRTNTEDVVYAPRFDRRLESSISSAVPVARDVPLVITEGNYLLGDDGGWEAVRPELDEIWFLDVDPAERRRRLIGRRMLHGEDEPTARAWVTRVDEPNGATVDDSRTRADFIIHLVANPANADQSPAPRNPTRKMTE